MDQQAQQERPQGDAAYRNAIVHRLIEQYLARTALPSQKAQVLTIERFYRLYRCVLAEGYGQ